MSTLNETQENALSLIKYKISDNGYYEIEKDLLEANTYKMLKKIGQNGVMVMLKNGEIRRILSVTIDLFNIYPAVIIDRNCLDKETNELLTSNYLLWFEQGYTWWIGNEI